MRGAPIRGGIPGILLLAAFLPAIAPPDAEEGIRARVAAYLDEPDEAKGEALQKDLLAAGGTMEDWERRVLGCRAHAPAEAGVRTALARMPAAAARRIEAARRADPATEARISRTYREQARIEVRWLDAPLLPDPPEVEYALRVPRGYDPLTPHPLIVALHGANGTGPRFLRTWDAAGEALDRRGAIVVAPTAPARVGWTNCLAGHEAIRTAILAAMRDLSVDPDAVYADGMSMGGGGAWRLLADHPDWIAGAVSRAGGPPSEAERPRLANAAGMRLLVYHGAEDRLMPIDHVRKGVEASRGAGIDVRFEEIPGRGHEPFRERGEEILGRLLEVRRDPFPRSVALVASSPVDARSRWLEILESRGEGMQNEELFITPGYEVLELRRGVRPPMRASAAILDGNRIRLDTRDVRRLRLLLSPRLIDLSKPIHLTANGHALPDRAAAPSPALLLREARRSGPLYPPAWAEVIVDVP